MDSLITSLPNIVCGLAAVGMFVGILNRIQKRETGQAFAAFVLMIFAAYGWSL